MLVVIKVIVLLSVCMAYSRGDRQIERCWNSIYSFFIWCALAYFLQRCQLLRFRVADALCFRCCYERFAVPLNSKQKPRPDNLQVHTKHTCKYCVYVTGWTLFDSNITFTFRHFHRYNSFVIFHLLDSNGLLRLNRQSSLIQWGIPPTKEILLLLWVCLKWPFRRHKEILIYSFHVALSIYADIDFVFGKC